MHKDEPTLDYARPATSAKATRGWIFKMVVAFVLSTGCACYFVFSLTDLAPMARVGSELYGPRDQYVGLAHQLHSIATTLGMCIGGSAIFIVPLVIRSGSAFVKRNFWRWGSAAGVVYTAVLAMTIRVAALVVGSGVGGPTSAEVAAYLIVGTIYPAIAGWIIAGLADLERTKGDERTKGGANL